MVNDDVDDDEDDDRYRGDPLWIDVKAMQANRAGFEAVGIAMDLISFIWWPTKEPFVFDAAALAARLGEQLPARGYSEKAIKRNLKGVKSFFTVLPDGRWAPSPKYFSLTDGNIDRMQQDAN